MPDVAGLQTRIEITTTHETEDWVNQISWAPDGSEVYAACADGAVLAVPAGGVGGIREVHRHEGAATCLSIAPDGAVASGGHDGTVRVDGRTTRLGEGDWIERVTWRPDGGRIAAACGRSVHLLGVDGTLEAESSPLGATVTCLAWHPKGVNVAAGSYGGVKVLRGRDGTLATKLPWKGSVLELTVSPDGRRLAHGNQDSTVHFWDIAKKRELHMWGYETKVRELAWRHDGRFLATGGGSSITIWDFSGKGPEGSRPLELDQHAAPVSWLGFRPANRMLASVAADGMLVLWETRASGPVVSAVAFDEPLSVASWSPDGKRIAVGGTRGTVGICEVLEA